MTQLLDKPMMNDMLKTSPSSSQTIFLHIRKETDRAPDTEYASNPGARFSMFQPTTAKQFKYLIAAAPTLFIRHCFNVADKKLYIVAVAVSVGTV